MTRKTPCAILAFYQWLFALVERLELRYIHGCFDLGRKVFEVKPALAVANMELVMSRVSS